ncbi:MAG TPA: hypothetical protein VJU87_07855 [Gemmatimonadaceae bacterium]|nr:hypothetical protein [Gemmatimonadaceae bacterium]
MTARTTAAPGRPAPERGMVAPWRLWFGLFGAPAAWALELIVNYALASHFCFPSDTPLATPTWRGTRLTTGIVSVVLVLVCVAALWTAVSAWRSTRAGHTAEHHHVGETGEGRVRFMAFAGILLSSVFLYGALMNAVPVMVMPLCTY